MRSLLSGWNIPAFLSALLLLCELGGCAAPPVPAGPDAGARAGIDATAGLPWWHSAADPLLARLVEGGLQSDPSLRHDQRALELARARSLQHGFRQWAARALGYPPQDVEGMALRLADARQRKAASIALAYVRVRRLQSALRLRRAFQQHFRDDSAIANWRREAGIVSSVDGGLAATMLGINASALAGTRARLAAAIATLARRTGAPPARLRLDLDDGAGLPRLALPAAKPAACGDEDEDARITREREVLAQAAARDSALRQLEASADLTVADARTAYRLGTGDFATLYVAETAALRTRLARVAARADAADAAIHILSAEGLAMTRARLPAAAHDPKDCGGD